VRRVLFYWRNQPVYSYPAMLYTGLVLGMIAGNYAANLDGIDSRRVYAATFLLIIPSLVGSRLLHVATHYDFYRSNHQRIWNLTEGGLAQYGGILLAVPVSALLLPALRLPFGAFWDIASFTILVGMIFTRVGCFLNGCCAGRPFDGWGSLYLPDAAGNWQRRIPTQLLEAGWAAVLLLSAVLIWRSLPFDGALFLFVSAGYAAGRLGMESMRDETRAGSPFTVHHGISLFIIVAAVAAILWRKFLT
jgi:phosphatidylglycerol:prolipoprotein diacylglycerol transferase